MSRLGLSRLKTLHGHAYFIGIVVPVFLYLYSGFTFYSVEQAMPFLSVALGLVLLGFFFEHYYSEFRYMNCRCGNIFLVRSDWECLYCGARQGAERLIIEPCRHCGRTLEIITCDECGEDLRL